MTTDERKIKLLIEGKPATAQEVINYLKDHDKTTDEEKTYTICVKCGKLPENKYMPLCKRCFDIENENQLLSIVILVSKKEGAKSERERILKIIEEHKHKIENDSDFWEKWINETLEQVRAEIEKG